MNSLHANQYEVDCVIDADRHAAPTPGNLVAGRNYTVAVREDGTTALLRPGRWVSPGGSPLSRVTIGRVDLDLLAQMYEEEATEGVLPRADSATRLAWLLGYMKPAR